MSALTNSLPLGFRWSAVAAGIKASGKPDVALAVCEDGANAAAMFTSNQVVAAPLTVGRAHLAASRGRVSAVLVNAGNANCATGEAGVDACRRSCIAVAEAFGWAFDEIFPSSTGIIGVPLPVEKLIGAIPAAKAALGSTAEHAAAFATAILTTDTKLKVAYASFEVAGRAVNLFGCAKGAGMIGPQLVAAASGPAGVGSAAAAPHATMLVYLFTDVAGCAEHLSALLAPAVDGSFNAISIDGDMSTNDTVLLLASGKSGVKLDETTQIAFAGALAAVCASLAHQIVDDGEGVTHVVRLQVTGAASAQDARVVARTIASSPLCKTAWSSADPNWGRILAAAGRGGGVRPGPGDADHRWAAGVCARCARGGIRRGCHPRGDASARVHNCARSGLQRRPARRAGAFHHLRPDA
jgi:glutamate N-acetyltransferase/amino-acid N-acetyltransferase